MSEGKKSTAVAIQQCWRGAIKLEALSVGDEHGHLGAILALGKDLLGLKVLGGGVAALQLGPSEQLGLLTWLCCVQAAVTSLVVLMQL